MGLVRELPKKGNLTRKFIPLSAFAAASLSFSAFAATDELNGTYRLISAKLQIVDTGEVTDAYGPLPNDRNNSHSRREEGRRQIDLHHAAGSILERWQDGRRNSHV
jgi:hypothetical protein